MAFPRNERHPWRPVPFQLPDPWQPARSLTNLTALVAALDRRQPRNVLLLHSVWAVHEVVAEEHRILESVNCVVGTHAGRLGEPL